MTLSPVKRLRWIHKRSAPPGDDLVHSHRLHPAQAAPTIEALKQAAKAGELRAKVESEVVGVPPEVEDPAGACAIIEVPEEAALLQIGQNRMASGQGTKVAGGRDIDGFSDQRRAVDNAAIP
jgi:hypothetical protein